MAKSFNLIEFYIKDVHFPNKKPDNAHKYDFGILFVYGGERPYGGAALLCIQTALKTGIGLVYSLFHGSQNDEILKQFPEVICLESLDQIKLTIKKESFIVAGPGTSDISKHKDLLNIVSIHDKTSILDAALIQAIKEIKFVTPPIITPHEGEAAKLLNCSSEIIRNNRERSIKEISNSYSCITVLKGKDTLICDGKTIYKCKHGSNNLAKAGSGDILAGLIGSLLAQGLSPVESCKTAVALHGFCAEHLEHRGYIANELIEKIAEKRFSLSVT